VLLVSAYIQHFTYLGLLLVLLLCGLGLPLPEDVALLAGGFLVHRGVIQYPPTLAVSLVGVLGGDCSLFFLGRHLGSGLVKYVGLLYPDYRQSIARMQNFMHRHGHRAVFYGRFLAGVRALIYLTAGSLGVPPARFLVYDLAGALISVPLMVSLGYLFANQIEAVTRYLGGFDRLLLAAVALSLTVWLIRAVLTARARRHRPSGIIQ
jgi:membrane protein DedA with SNARE-associated domain